MNEKTLRILIVDDSRTNINILNEILRVDYQIKVALDGDQALQRAATSPRPDLILLDVIMPGMDGFEVCRRLKRDADTADTPVIFLTAKTEEENLVRGFEVGAVDYVTKPFKLAELLMRVKTHLSLHCLRLQLERQNTELQSALDEIQTLRGFLPICAWCKKIRRDDGTWEQIERFIAERSLAEFTHGICEKCEREYMRNV